MSADIVLSNITPNQKWFAKLSDAGDDALAELFNTLAHAEAGTNRVAYGSFAFGTKIVVVLTNDTEDPEIGYFNLFSTWHLKATFLDGDPMTIIEFGPDTILPAIIDPLLVTSQACEDRALLEIGRHTMIEISHILNLGTHMQDLEIDNKRKLTDNMRGLNQQVRVDDFQLLIQIQDKKVSITDILTVTEFKDAKR